MKRNFLTRFKPTGDRGPAGRGTKRSKRWMGWTAIGLSAFLLLSMAVGLARSQERGLGLLGPGGPASTGVGALPAAQPTGAAASTEAFDKTSAPLGYDARQGGTAAGRPGAEAPAGNTAPTQAQPWDRMIIRTASLQMQVQDVALSMDRVRLLAGTHGGFVSQAESRLSGKDTYATITLQVPSAEFDATVSELRKLTDKPITESVSSSDVTEEYTDLQSQLKNLQATEQRIQLLMGKTERLEDVLTLDRELRQIRGEVERVQGRVNFLSKRAEMSTISVSLSPISATPVEPVVQVDNAWDPGEIALRAWNSSLEFLSGVGTVLITGIVYLWWLVPLGLFLALVILLPRRRMGSGTSTGGEAGAVTGA